MFDDCIIKTIPSDAESREEQDSGKQCFVGQMTAEFQAVFQLVVAKTQKRNKSQTLISLAEEGSFPCKLC